MRRYLVVAHQTLGSRELLEALRAQAKDGPCSFHLVVPEHHAGLTYTEGEARATARRQLEEALARFRAEDLSVTGEVGEASPVEAAGAVVRREGKDAFAAVIVCTLPHGVSKWLRLDAPTRIQRNLSVPVVHVIGHPITA